MDTSTNVMKFSATENGSTTTTTTINVELNVSLKLSDDNNNNGDDDATAAAAAAATSFTQQQQSKGGQYKLHVPMNGTFIVNGGDAINSQSSISTLTTTTTTTTSSSSCNNETSTDTKLIFFEMMARLIRHQLVLCDSQSNGTATDISFPRLKHVNDQRPYMLQPSLFPLKYPTVYFVDEDDILSDVPQEVKPFLRWKITSITANTMRAIVVRSGYKLMAVDRNKNKTFNNWNAIWCKHLRVNEFQSIGYYQRVNHFPGSFNFGRKDRLWLNLKAKIEKYGGDSFGNFHPPTFIMPADYSTLISYWNSNESICHNNHKSQCTNSDISKPKLFICKPPASARGQGIDIVSNLDELNILMLKAATSNNNNNDSNNNNNGSNKKPKVTLVVQEYISNPCLLHNDAKFDLRVYVLITSILPLRVYVYDEGLVRFAANRYSNNVDDIKNQYIHLTNYSVNKNCVEYMPNSNVDGQDGHKWTLKTLWKYLSLTKGVDVDQIWQQIVDLIVKTVISAQSNILTLLKKQLKNPRSCFELLGFDIILDDNLKLWLLEVNITPSLRADSVLDFSVKNQLVKDILNTLGYQLSPRFRRHYNFGHLVCPEKNDILTQMSIPNVDKHKHFEQSFSTINKCEDVNLLFEQIVEQLNDDDIVQLMESEDELNRCGKFIRAFPSMISKNYLKYFDYCHYYDLLLSAWETKYNHQRQMGIERLQKYILDKNSIETDVDNIKNQLKELDKNIAALRQQQQQQQQQSS